MLETAIQSEEAIGMPTIPLKLMPENVATSVFNTVPINNIITLDPTLNNDPILVTPLVHSPYENLMYQQQATTKPIVQQQQQIKYAQQYPYAPQHPYRAPPPVPEVASPPPGQAIMLHTPPQPPPAQPPVQQQLQAVAAALAPPGGLLGERDINIIAEQLLQEDQEEGNRYPVRNNRGQRAHRANVNSTQIQQHKDRSRSNTPDREEKRRLKNIAKLLDELKLNSTSLQQPARPPSTIPRPREQTPPRNNQRREQSPDRRSYYQYGSNSYNRDRYSNNRYPSNERNRYPSNDRNRY